MYFRTIEVLERVFVSAARRPEDPKLGFCFSFSGGGDWPTVTAEEVVCVKAAF